MDQTAQVIMRVMSRQQLLTMISNGHYCVYQILSCKSNPSLMTMLYSNKFYELAKNAFVVVQTTDTTLYSNVIIYKGVIWSMN